MAEETPVVEVSATAAAAAIAAVEEDDLDGFLSVVRSFYLTSFNGISFILECILYLFLGEIH